jgi:hypothetical protein
VKKYQVQFYFQAGEPGTRTLTVKICEYIEGLKSRQEDGASEKSVTPISNTTWLSSKELITESEECKT